LLETHHTLWKRELGELFLTLQAEHLNLESWDATSKMYFREQWK